MCSNYEAVTRADRMLAFFGVVHEDSPSIITFPTGLAPIIRLSEVGKRQAVDGHFGLLPHFAKELTFGRRTYNARSETVATLPSFRDAWRRGQRCVVPAEAIFEPEYDANGGNPVRTRIWQPGEVPMGIAGIWTSWRDPADQSEHFSFAMLTVNAAGHPVMQRFHRPADEKRMVVILDPQDYDEWLTCSTDEAPRYFTQWMGTLHTAPAPLPPRARRPKREGPPPPELSDEPQLF